VNREDPLTDRARSSTAIINRSSDTLSHDGQDVEALEEVDLVDAC
jgi:hypothetical protein